MDYLEVQLTLEVATCFFDVRMVHPGQCAHARRVLLYPISRRHLGFLWTLSDLWSGGLVCVYQMDRLRDLFGRKNHRCSIMFVWQGM
jgi:hypothetical protein